MAATSNLPSAVQVHLKSAIHLWSWSPGSHLRPGGIWLHRLLSLRGVINHVVEPTSILVTRGAQRAKTNRLDAVGLLRVLALKIHGRSRRLPIIVVQSVEEEDALHSPRSLGRGRRSVPNGPVPPAADP
jgi:hypothetical protein